MSEIDTAAYRNACERGAGLKGAGLKRLLDHIDAQAATIKAQAEELDALRDALAKVADSATEQGILRLREIKDAVGREGLKIEGEMAEAITLMFVDMYRNMGGVNFVTTGATDNNGQAFEVTVQRVGGLLPSQKLDAAEADNARLIAENAALRERCAAAEADMVLAVGGRRCVVCANDQCHYSDDEDIVACSASMFKWRGPQPAAELPFVTEAMPEPPAGEGADHADY